MAKLDWGKAAQSKLLSGTVLDVSGEIGAREAQTDADWLEQRKAERARKRQEHRLLIKEQKRLFKKLRLEHEAAQKVSGDGNG